jgi:hypothetical protein
VFQHRAGQGAQQVKALIELGRFGRLRFGLAETLWQRGADYYDVWWRGTWEQECGGVNMGHAIHSVDMLAWLMGEPDSLIADATTVKLDIEVEDTSAAIVRFRNGAVGQIVVTVNAQDNRSRLEISATSCRQFRASRPTTPHASRFACRRSTLRSPRPPGRRRCSSSRTRRSICTCPSFTTSSPPSPRDAGRWSA